MQIMISGSRGMLATALIDKLLEDNGIEKILALSSDPIDVLAKHGEDARLVAVNFDEAIKVLDSENIPLLIHTAFPRKNDAQLIEKGLMYTRNLLKHVPSSCSVIHISSQSVYDHARAVPAREELTAVLPSSPYGEAKLKSEEIVSEVCSGSMYSSIRLASLVSPQFEDRIINKLVRNGLQEGKIRIFGPNNIYAFLDVLDAVDGISSMIYSRKKKWQKVYNLGPHEGAFSLEELARKVQKALATQGVSSVIESALDLPKKNSALDSSKFEEDFFWSSRISIEDSIGRIVAYQSKNS